MSVSERRAHPPQLGPPSRVRRLTGAEWHWSVHTGTLVCLFVCVFVRAAAVAAQLELMVSRYLEVILVGSSVHPKPCSACSFRTVCLYAAFTHLRCSVHHPTPSRTHDHILQRCALQRCALQRCALQRCALQR